MKNIILFCLVTSSLLFTACTPNGPHKPMDKSKLGATTVSGSDIISYQDVKPIFEQYCSRCHPALREPDWLDFDQAHANAGKLVNRVNIQKDMPQSGSPEAQRITQKDRDQLKAWVDGGAVFKKGDFPVSADTNQIAPEKIEHSVFAEVQTCTACHGTDGNIMGGSIPKLAGQSADYIFIQLKNFATDQRVDRIMKSMNGIAKTLFENYSDDEVKSIANQFAGTQPELKREPLTDQDVYQIVAGQKISNQYACASCHMMPGSAKPITSETPVIAGQNKEYLYNQLMNFKSGNRKFSQMNLIVRDLNKEDFEALSIFYSNIYVSK